MQNLCRRSFMKMAAAVPAFCSLAGCEESFLKQQADKKDMRIDAWILGTSVPIGEVVQLISRLNRMVAGQRQRDVITHSRVQQIV